MRGLAELPRAWWSIALPGYREHSGGHFTYSRFTFDRLPPVRRQLDSEFQWLVREPAVSHSLAEVERRPSRPATADQLELLLAGHSVALPGSFMTFVASEEPRARVRSCTDCYLDLADFAVPVSSGGSLIHLLSDSQWGLHWLLYTGADGSEALVVTDRPFGFDLSDEDDEEVERVFDPGCGQVEVCAESFSEFVYRFWIENEIWFRLTGRATGEPPLTDEQHRYAEHYSRPQSAPG
jgi:hypothetical protein